MAGFLSRMLAHQTGVHLPSQGVGGRHSAWPGHPPPMFSISPHWAQRLFWLRWLCYQLVQDVAAQYCFFFF